MKRGTFWMLLNGLILLSLVFTSCSKTTSTTTTTQTQSQTTITTSATIPPATSTTKVTTSTTATTGNWWDKLGKPQYGGDMILRVARDVLYFDPYQGESQLTMMWGWMEQMFVTDWTIDPNAQSYQLSFWDNQYAKGQLIESWEFPSPGTYVLHVRKGIHWQNIPPANGREFTADDIAFHFQRMLGLGSGYTKPAPYWGTVAWTKSVISVSATDKYTVVMNWNTPNPEFVNQNLEAPGASTTIENPEAIKQWGDVNDWHHAIGTGPFILTDFVSGSSITMVKNPNYWGYDERYPQNQLPYVNSVRYLVMPDDSTALAAMRTGKIDIMDAMLYSQAQSMKKTNPEIVQVGVPLGNGITIDPRNDLKPFNDLRVRKALQLAIDLPTIAKSYYGGTADSSPISLTSMYLTGWGFPYAQWPQDLKNEYAYNPTAAKQLLADAGFPTGFKTDIVVDETVDLDLLQIIKSYFNDIGINMEIRPMDAATFASFVQISHKNDALCIRKTGSLGLGFYPLRDLLRFGAGQPANVAMVAGFDHFNNDAVVATSTDAVKKILKDANEDVARQHYVVSLLQPTVFNFCQPWLKGYNGQYGATAGTTGTFFLFFYEARFWIDQPLKKTLGH